MLAPVVPEPYKGLLVAGDAADLTAASLADRWVRMGGANARLLSGHEGTLLVVKALRVFAWRLTRGAVSPYLTPISYHKFTIIVYFFTKIAL
jgi:hypothetical protein